MKPTILLLLPLLALQLPASAQWSYRARAAAIPDLVQELPKNQQYQLSTQAEQLFIITRPVIQTASKSTVSVSYLGQRLSYGTVVKSPLSGENIILSKWSEIARYQDKLTVTTANGKPHQATVIGIYPEHDLAVLKSQIELQPLNLTQSNIPRRGDMLLLASPEAEVLSFGVVSVEARSLRESDKAYLGVQMDFNRSGKLGTPLNQVMERSPASRAGLRQGDVVLAIDQNPIKSAIEMRNTLQQLVPGSKVEIRYRRGDKMEKTHVQLGSRPAELDARRFPPKRMKEMQKMGTVPNKVNSNFPSVIQSDMPIQSDKTPRFQSDNFSNECGGPVVDLDGQVVGIMIARGSRIKTFIVPSSTLRGLLNTQPVALKNQTSQNNVKKHLVTPQRPARRLRSENLPRGWRKTP